jgi:Excalibur calcium-binding domain
VNKLLLLSGVVIAGMLSGAGVAGAVEVAPSMLNPAVTQRTIATTVCVPKWVKSQRDVSPKTKDAVFAAAGIAKADQPRYVVDHVIPLELGGSNDRSNLTAQPVAESKAKDAVENTLRRSVCSSKLTLVAAQTAIAADWRTAITAPTPLVGATSVTVGVATTVAVAPVAITTVPVITAPVVTVPSVTAPVSTVRIASTTVALTVSTLPPTVQPSVAVTVPTVASTIAVPVTAPITVSGLTRFANCADLNAQYPHGVGRSGAVDKVSGTTPPVTTFLVNDALYHAQPKTLDRDNDGIACEQP